MLTILTGLMTLLPKFLSELIQEPVLMTESSLLHLASLLVETASLPFKLVILEMMKDILPLGSMKNSSLMKTPLILIVLLFLCQMKMTKTIITMLTFISQLNPYIKYISQKTAGTHYKTESLLLISKLQTLELMNNGTNTTTKFITTLSLLVQTVIMPVKNSKSMFNGLGPEHQTETSPSNSTLFSMMTHLS